jgi:hypothetical protein
MQEAGLLEIIIVIACSTFMFLFCGWNGGRPSKYYIRAKLQEIERKRRESMLTGKPWIPYEAEKRRKSKYRDI